jgi:hypothetical protein
VFYAFWIVFLSYFEMKGTLRLFALGVLMVWALGVWGQASTYRYSTLSGTDGSTFYALHGTTGQLYYMNDYGNDPAVWKSYGSMIRMGGRNNLQFAALRFNSGNSFYAFEANTGQLHYMNDYGDVPGIWKSYGTPARAEGLDNLQIAVEHDGDGVKCTAIDGTTGQVFYMFDWGDNAGTWRSYGGMIK